MAERNVYHVTPGDDGQWLARLNDNGEVHPFRSREAALADAREGVARQGSGEIVIHRPDGSVEETLRMSERVRPLEPEAVPSKAAIAGHPIHPMLIPFPIAFLVALPVVDIVFAFARDAFWADVAFILLSAGLATGALAALVGLVDFAGLRPVRKRRVAWWHLLANAGALTISLVNLLIRVGDRADAIVPAGLLLSLVAAGLLGAGGWFGGELAYRHRIGVARWSDSTVSKV